MTGQDATSQARWTSINIADHPFHNSIPQTIKFKLPPKEITLGITIKDCQYHNMPYIQSSLYKSLYQKEVNPELKHNTWILAVGNNNPITALQAMTDTQNLQHKDKRSDPITFVLAKRSSHPTPTQIEQD